MNEPDIPLFQLGRVRKPYIGSPKPQDWPIDYVSSVHIAGAIVDGRSGISRICWKTQLGYG